MFRSTVLLFIPNSSASCARVIEEFSAIAAKILCAVGLTALRLSTDISTDICTGICTDKLKLTATIYGAKWPMTAESSLASGRYPIDSAFDS